MRHLAPFVVLPLLASTPPDLPSLFPMEADVFARTEGPVRVDLPPEVLREVRSDLSDVRIFDPEGREIPFAIDGGADRPASVEALRTASVVVSEVAREVKPQGDAPDLFVESYRLQIPAEARLGVWDLVFDVSAPAFVAHVRLASQDREPREISLFRLGNVPREKTRVALDESPSADLLVTITNDGRFLEPAMRLESSSPLPSSPSVTVPLEEVARSSENGWTELVFRRPRGLVPDRLEIETKTPLFDREVEVWDEEGSADRALLGRHGIFRVQSVARIEELSVPVTRAGGDRLRLRIRDGNSPPLEAVAVRASLRTPSLIFAVPPRGDSMPAALLRFGGGRVLRPAYDLASLVPVPGQSVDDRRADAMKALLEHSASAGVRLGPVRRNPRFDPRPSLAFAMRPGGEVDRRLYSRTAALDVPFSPNGLTRVRLSPTTLSALRDDLADLRVVDAESRQWPFLLARDVGVDWVDLPVRSPPREARTSVYVAALPVTPIALDRLVVDSEIAFFDRAFRITARVVGEEAPRELARGRLARRAEDPRPVTIGFRPVRIESIELVVEDGDDAPLALLLRGRAPITEMLLVAPAGSYSLLGGNRDDAPPQYEMERVRDVILAVEALPATVTELESNPDFSPRLRMYRGGGPAKVALWAALGIAVLVLGTLTIRLARREEG